MPRVSITKIHDQEEAVSVLSLVTEQNLQNIRRRAYDFFLERGELIGNDLADWLRAEREVLWKPHSEMFENDFAIVLRVAVPGFDEKSIHVTAAPFSLLIEASDMHTHHGLDSRLRFCEFGQKLFRSFELTTRIDPKTVSATLDRGILEVVATRAAQPSEPRKMPASLRQGVTVARTAVAC